MAAYDDISKHFKGLRAHTARRKGRPDPFATGFEDDSDEQGKRRSRSKTKQAPVGRALDDAKAQTSVNTTPLPSARDLLRDSDNGFLAPPQPTDRRASPARNPPALSRGDPAYARRGSVDTGALSRGLSGKTNLPTRDPRNAVVQAAGTLAFLDDSDSDQEPAPRPTRGDRHPSPAPRKLSAAQNTRSATPKGTRSLTPRGARDQQVEQPPRHTVASAFAGTKYLEDSSSDEDDEEPPTPRNNSLEEAISDGPPSPDRSRHEVKRVDKPKVQDGGGVSWRAFSQGRAEQRNQEIEALQARFKQRGKSIAFVSHALTDDGERVPLQHSPEQTLTGDKPGPKKPRGKSPPRRARDVEPTEDEMADGPGLATYDPVQFKTNPFTGESSVLSYAHHITCSDINSRRAGPQNRQQYLVKYSQRATW